MKNFASLFHLIDYKSRKSDLKSRYFQPCDRCESTEDVSSCVETAKKVSVELMLSYRMKEHLLRIWRPQGRHWATYWIFDVLI